MAHVETRTYADRQDYQKQYQKEWRNKHRDDAVKQLGSVCCICSSTLFLEFHHQDPRKKIDHRIWSWSKERREAEIAKCKLYCKTHHEHWHSIYDRIQAGKEVDTNEAARYGFKI